jgi:hypothetical protein
VPLYQFSKNAEKKIGGKRMYYTVRGNSAEKKYLEVVKELKDGYEVKITAINENYTTHTKDFLSKTLFNTCLRTGYISDPRPDSLMRRGA